MIHPIRSFLLALTLAAGLAPFALVAPARAQGEAGQMLIAAYSLRRLGKFEEAAAAFERALDVMGPGKGKEAVAQEAAELFRVMGRLDKALILYRRNNDSAREIEVLFELGRAKDALTLARYLKHTKGEALALAKLGETEQALTLLKGAGRSLARERAELLVGLGRHKDAAAAYAEAEDFYSQATELEAAKATTEARRAYEDAIEQLKFYLRHEAKPRVISAKQAFDSVQGAVARERARLELAKAYGDFGDGYRRLARSYVGAGQAKANAVALAQQAVKHLQLQRDTLEDKAQGGDAFGKKAIEAKGLSDRIREVQAELARYQAG